MAMESISTRVPPGPRGVPFFGSAFAARRDPLAFFSDAVRDHGDVAHFSLGPFDYYLINDPAAVHHVLVENAKNYTKSRGYEGLKLVLGDGLLTSEGDFWRRQRKLAQPAFHRERLAGFAASMARDTADMLQRWTARDPSVPFDLHEEMAQLTFRIVGRTLFRVDVAAESDMVGPALTVAMHHADKYANALFRIPPWLPTPDNARFRSAMRTLDEIVLRIINERRRAPADDGDLLSMLMAVRDEETGTGMTDRQLRDEVITMVLAGHETTANAVSWAFYLLSRHPDVQRRLFQEVSEVLGDRAPTVEDLPRLTYTSKVIHEAMRLYPPAWAFERAAVGADEVMGYRIPAGAIVGICPYTLHRNPRYWDNPEGFDPERFAPDAVAARPRHAYLPFGGGQRQCIGNAFALMELQIVVAMVTQRVRLDLAPGYPIGLDPRITLRPKAGIWMRLREQHASSAKHDAAVSPPAASRCPMHA